MRRGEYWMLFTDLCERYPGGVEVHYEFPWWRCVVRTSKGVRQAMAQRIEDAVECIADNLAREEAEAAP